MNKGSFRWNSKSNKFLSVIEGRKTLSLEHVKFLNQSLLDRENSSI